MNLPPDTAPIPTLPWRRDASLGLLLGSGCALALVVALAKLALRSGLKPIDVAAACSAGAALWLAPVAARAAFAQAARRRWLGGCVLLAGVSYALPNVSQAWVAGHVGAGLASMMLALTPLLTLAFATALGMEPARRGTLAGLLLGLVGTWLLIAPAAASGASWRLAALLCGLIAPTANAAGNLIRAKLLPAGVSPLATAWAVLTIAALALTPLAVFDGLAQRLTPFGALVLAAAAAATAVFNLLLFRLQVAAGPVRLSQVGYVAALAGVVLSALMFAEPLRWNVALAALLIAAGVRRVSRTAPR